MMRRVATKLVLPVCLISLAGCATHQRRAEIRIRKGEDDKALADLAKAIGLKPDYADAYATRGSEAAVGDQR